MPNKPFMDYPAVPGCVINSHMSSKGSLIRCDSLGFVPPCKDLSQSIWAFGVTCFTCCFRVRLESTSFRRSLQDRLGPGPANGVFGSALFTAKHQVKTGPNDSTRQTLE